MAVDEVHLHSGDDVSPVQQKSTVANKSAVHLSGQKDVQGSNVKDPGAAICGGDGLHLVVSDSDEEGPAPAPNYVRPPHSLRDKGAVEQLTAWISQLAPAGPAHRRPEVLHVCPLHMATIATRCLGLKGQEMQQPLLHFLLHR